MKLKIPEVDVQDALTSISNKKVLVLGDTIIDKYTFVNPKGRAVKDPILSTEFVREETYAGGILAIAKHISSFTKKVTVMSVLGDTEDYLNFIKSDLPENIDFIHFTRPNAPTTVKQRYIDDYRNHKLFKVENIIDTPIPPEVEEDLIQSLSEELKKHDFVVVGDFGHGMLTEKVKRFIEEHAKFLCLNVQSNSSNMGFNYVNLYKKPHFIVMNEVELRMPMMMRFEPIEDVAAEFAMRFNFPCFMVTLGKKGSLLYDNGKWFMANALVTKTVDTIGAGDASFAIASLLVQQGIKPQFIPAIANCAAAINTQYMGNKDYVTKESLLAKIGEFNGME